MVEQETITHDREAQSELCKTVKESVQMGRPKLEKRDTRVQIRINLKLLERLEIMVEQEGFSRSSMIHQAIKEYLDRKEKNNLQTVDNVA